MPTPPRPAKPHRSSRFLTTALATAAIGLGWLAVRETMNRSRTPAGVSDGPLVALSSTPAWEKRNPGAPSPARPRIANVQVLDFDGDGRNDLLVCDIARNAVVLFRGRADGGWDEKILAADLNTPVHATVVDLDKDGDKDVVVSVLGSIVPSDRMIGKVVALINDGAGRFTPQVLRDDLYRVADVQAADLDGDGDIDLAVAVFGYAHGEVLWLEQTGPLQFRDHHLLDRPGTIHVPIGDFDGDGDLDIMTVSSQDEEEIWGLENLGGGKFKSRRIWFTHNFDIGSGGLVAVDLNRDGKLDLLLPVGDNLEHGLGWPQPYHGCYWFENLGGWKFAPKRIGSFGGTYAAAPGDINGDGHLDVVLVSMANDWNNPQRPSVVWLENDGAQQFKLRVVDTEPVTLITAACGDLDGDGRTDIVAGGLDLPDNAIARPQRAVTLWLNRLPPRK